ncbi:MAG: pentapeptide repeat-containing protein [Bacteroidales bacterium]|jgi:uncharacterized protein YjbI with pentapeptide repeats|nr:pentapeptide repeat-containing protein [Bacteroidales bacterium]
MKNDDIYSFFDTVFEKKTQIKKGIYENCTFKNCFFSDLNFLDFVFDDCEFIDSNLSNLILNNSAFRSVRFISSKIVGLHFENCNNIGFSIDFLDCKLNLCSFYEMKLIKSKYKNTEFEDCDFSNADLSLSIFDKCNFINSTFFHTNLSKCDFRTASKYAINPEINNVKFAKFTYPEVLGLLSHLDIHIEI